MRAQTPLNGVFIAAHAGHRETTMKLLSTFAGTLLLGLGLGVSGGHAIPISSSVGVQSGDSVIQVRGQKSKKKKAARKSVKQKKVRKSSPSSRGVRSSPAGGREPSSGGPVPSIK